MTLDTALFLVDRGGQNLKASGSSIGDKIKNGDSVLVQRGNSKFKATYSDGFNTIADADLLLVRQGAANYKVTGANFLDLFGSGPEIEYFRHTMSSPQKLCPGVTKYFYLQWKVVGDTTCVITLPDGSVFSTNKEGNLATSISELGTYEYTMTATGSNGVVEIRKIYATTKCDLPTNSLTGANKANYGQTFNLQYTQSGHDTGELAGSTVTQSSGYVYVTNYPTKDLTICYMLKSTNCCGTTTTSAWCVPVTGYSIEPTSLNGVPSSPKKNDQFYVNPSYSNASKLKNVSYEWELEAGIDSGFANFNNAGAGRPGEFKSTAREPKIYCNNNTHNKQGNPVFAPPGHLPDGVKLTLTITNDDNGESSTQYQYFKIHPQF